MKTPKKRRIIGLDPGLASTGWGVLDFTDGKILYIDHGIINTKAEIPRAERLFFIMRSVRLIIEEYRPSEAAVEILFFGKNVTSAIPVAEARGVISAVLAEKGIHIHELTPNAIKKGVTGHAGADKKQIQEMVRLLLNLEKAPKPDHAADALAASICAVNVSF
jgi:crossover junction endodeoxyribonuclease RuvC